MVICHTTNTWHYSLARASQEKRHPKRRGQGVRGTPPMKSQQNSFVPSHINRARFFRGTFRPTGKAQSSQHPALQCISARDGRSTRSPSRPRRGAQGDRPFPHRARQNATDTGVDLKRVPKGFFHARGSAADFRLRGGSGR